MSNSTTTDVVGYTYECVDPTDAETCAPSCVGLEACEECGCAVVELEGGGPWGPVMDVLLCLLPIFFLIVVTIKPHPMPTTTSLPMAAVIMFLVRVMYLGSDPLLSSGCVILGLHEAFTPLSIMAGAIILFETMEATYCMPYMMREMKALTQGHPISEMMLIFAFAYMVEGASGFGTPVALGAPMLVSTGHPAFESVVVLLIFNTFATVWGAVGTPIWFGFGELDLSEEEFLQISYQAAAALAVGSVIIIPWVMTVLVPGKLVRKNLCFVFSALLVTVGPSLGISFVSYEFPSLMGGLIGVGLTGLLIKCKVGLKSYSEENEEEVDRKASEIESVPEDSFEESEVFHDAASQDGSDSSLEENDIQGTNVSSIQEGSTLQNSEKGNIDIGKEMMMSSLPSFHETIDEHLGPRKSFGEGYLKELLMRTFPIWGVVVLLVITRVEQIGVKYYLTLKEPYFEIYFQTYGTFRCSVSIVLQLLNILTYPNLNWKYEVLYIPFIIPFVLISVMTMIIFRKDLKSTPRQIVGVVAKRLYNPMIALLGALTLVQLMIKEGTTSPAYILGSVLSSWFKQGFVVISPLLGALGSFFSGSTTVSNLTFGSVQLTAAQSVKTSETAMLALQSVGASAGNGICLNNIIAACAVVGLNIGEGKVLGQTYKYVLASTTISTVVMLAAFFRFG